MSDWNAARRILAVRLDSLGDVLMTTPALRALRAGPRVDHITLLTSPSGAAIARMVPEIDDVIVYDAPWMKAGVGRTPAYDHAMIDTLGQGNFDAAAVFTVYSQTPFPAAMLCRLAGIPLILAHCRERAYGLISDAVAETEPEQQVRHEVQRHLDLVATFGWSSPDQRMSVVPPIEAIAGADALISHLGLGALGWALVHPGVTASSRRYPPEGYAHAMRTLAQEDDMRFVLTGDAGEAELCDQILAEAGVGTSLAGRLDLAALVALIARAPLVITNNTGPAHIAAALGRPLIDLYALTNPQHTPWGTEARVLSHDVPCRWCYKSICPEGHHLCLRGVGPERIVDAARDLMPAEESVV